MQSPGARVQYNIVHDVSRRDYGGWGIYLDEGSHDVAVEKNLVYRCQDGALFAHHNRQITAENNIFAFNRTASRSGWNRRVRAKMPCRNLFFYKEGKAVGTMVASTAGARVCLRP